MPSISTCSITGVLYRPSGTVAAGKSFVIKRVYTTDHLISSEHTIYKTGNDGSITFTLPQSSTAYVYANAVGFDTWEDGTPIYVPAVATAELYSIVDGTINVPTVIPVLNPLTASFLSLNDTPNSYVGQAAKIVAVNSGENGLEFSTMTITGQDLSPYATTASLSAYATTGHTHSAYSTTSHTHSNYVQTTGNETISGSKTFSESPKTSASPSNNNDLTNKLYVDTQIGLVNSYVLIDNQQTNDSTPTSTQLSGFGTDTVYYYDVLAVGRYDVDSSAVYLQRTDYVINNAGGTIYMLGIYPQHLTTNGITGAVGHSLYKDGDHIVSSITGDATNEMTWYIYANIKGV